MSSFRHGNRDCISFPPNARIYVHEGSAMCLKPCLFWINHKSGFWSQIDGAKGREMILNDTLVRPVILAGERCSTGYRQWSG